MFLKQILSDKSYSKTSVKFSYKVAVKVSYGSHKDLIPFVGADSFTYVPLVRLSQRGSSTG